MLKLNVTPEHARARLFEVPHQTFQSGIPRHWHVSDDGHVRAQSVCWLYCSGKTDRGSDDAARAAERVFNELLEISFSAFDVRVDRDWAQWAPCAERNIEAELTERLDYSRHHPALLCSSLPPIISAHDHDARISATPKPAERVCTS